MVFLGGGLLCAAADVGVMQWLLTGGARPAYATAGGFLVGLLVSYSFHARVTFNSLSSAATVMRFLCLVLLNYLLTWGCVSLALALGAAAIAGKLVSLPLVAVNGFLLGKFWIFRAQA